MGARRFAPHLLLALTSLERPLVHGYGEGLFATDAPRLQSGAWVLAFVSKDGEALGPHCQKHPAGVPLEVRLRGTVPDAPLGSELCAEVFIRSDDSRNWWYLVPPAPSGDARRRVCGNVTLSSAVPWRVPAVEILLSISLPVGYSLLTAELNDSNGASHSALAHAAVWSSGLRDGELDTELTLLADAHAVVRADEHEDRAQRRHVIATNADRYEQSDLRLHPRLTLRGSAKSQLRDLLDPSLVAALSRNSPQALWEIIRGIDHITRCRGTVAVDEAGLPLTAAHSAVAACSRGVYTLPVLNPAASQQLVEEVLHAKRSPIGA